MQTTSIQWCDLTWNPTRGCSRVSPGCKNCYAEKIAARFSGPGKLFEGFAEFRVIGGKREAHWTGQVGLIEKKLLEPLSWKRKALAFAAKHGRKPRCFVNSMSDPFHERLDFILIDCVFAVMALCPEIDFLVLTKRADRLPQYVNKYASVRVNRQIELWMEFMSDFPREISFARKLEEWPLPNVWAGVSVEDQQRADERIPYLLRTPAAVRFISAEPLLGPLHLWKLCSPDYYENNIGYETYPLRGMQAIPDCDWEHPKLDWVIVGSESGSGARPCEEVWVRSIKNQCVQAGVAFFYKQASLSGKKIPTPELDGRKWVEFPAVK